MQWQADWRKGDVAAAIAVLPCLTTITVQETVHVTAFSAYDRHLPAVLRKGGEGWGNGGWGDPSDASSTLGLRVRSLGLCSVDGSCTSIQHAHQDLAMCLT